MAENPLTPLSQGSVGVLRRLLGPAATELGEMLADRVRHYRSKNIKNVMESTGVKIGSQTVSELPLRFSIPLLERASLEDDHFLSEMWANLLAKAAVNLDDEHYLISRILADLTPNSAQLLQTLVDDFHEEEDWFGKLNWEEQWLFDFEFFVKKHQKKLLYDPKNKAIEADREKLVTQLSTFEHELPFWAFQFDLPVVMPDIVEAVEAGGNLDDFGQVSSLHSFEHAALQILEREQLVIRRQHKFRLDYCDLQFSYVKATALGVSLVQTCMTGISEPEDEI